MVPPFSRAFGASGSEGTHTTASLFPVSRTHRGTWMPQGSALWPLARSHHWQLTPREDGDRGTWTWARIWVHIKRFVLRNWLRRLWGLACLRSTGQARAAVVRQNFFFKNPYCLGEAHPRHPGESPLLSQLVVGAAVVSTEHLHENPWMRAQW